MTKPPHRSKRPHQRHPLSVPYRVAVTGHQNLRNHATVQFVNTAFYLLLTQLQHQHLEGIVALSGLAEGADTLFAEAALALHIPVEAFIAHGEVYDNFAPGRPRERYLRLRDCSQVVHQLAFTESSAAAYTALGHALVVSCDLLIAAWDGRPPVDAGGTGGVVAYARQQGRPVVHIHTVQHTITPLHLP